MACLLERLCSANGVSGNEKKVRDIIIQEITPHADEIRIDTMGNIIVRKGGKKSARVLIMAHMDEPGFIVSDITETGFLKFKSVGTVDPRVIVSKRVLIGENNIHGVIGMKAIHLQKKSERENVVKSSDLFIDIGAKNKEDAEKVVALGDFIAFDTQFDDLGETIKGKALDARIGCACLIELLKQDFENEFYAVFAVQSEIEGRGAGVAAYGINPDIAIVMDTVEAADMFGVSPQEKTAPLGSGAVLTYIDKRAIFDRKSTDAIADMAENNGIKIQIANSATGSYDSQTVQTSRAGTAVIRLAVPCRYSHTPVCMASKSDINDAAELAFLILKNGGKYSDRNETT